MHILSLGGGIQSSALLLMSEAGEVDPPCEAAIFADTGWERQGTYRYIEYLKSVVSIPIHTASHGNIRANTLNAAHRHATMMPFFTRGSGKVGKLRRQCTYDYKIAPIRKELRRQYGFQQFAMWIGISIDELERSRPSDVKYITHRYPLLEKRVSRADCVAWLKRNNHPLPVRSSCVGCPLHSNSEWAEMRGTPEWRDAVDFDEAIRELHIADAKRLGNPLYLHRSGLPLADAPLGVSETQLELFDKQEECEGGCFL